MLYQDFISQFPPSNTGEHTEKKGNVITVTWMMFKEQKNSNDIIPEHAELEINLKSLDLKFSLNFLEDEDKQNNQNKKTFKQTGTAFVDNEEVEFTDEESADFFPIFLERVQFWFETTQNRVLH